MSKYGDYKPVASEDSTYSYEEANKKEAEKPYYPIAEDSSNSYSTTTYNGGVSGYTTKSGGSYDEVTYSTGFHQHGDKGPGQEEKRESMCSVQ